jgi:hypothetical protein
LNHLAHAASSAAILSLGRDSTTWLSESGEYNENQVMRSD